MFLNPDKELIFGQQHCANQHVCGLNVAGERPIGGDPWLVKKFQRADDGRRGDFGLHPGSALRLKQSFFLKKEILLTIFTGD